MQRTYSLNALLFVAGTAGAQYSPPDPSGFEGLIVETYYIADANDAADLDGGGGLVSGAKTYRVFVDLKPGYKLLTVGGYLNHPLTMSSTTGFWNNDDRGEAWGWDLPAQHLNKNTVAIDSWLSMGAASTQHWGIPKGSDPNGSVVGGSNNDGGSTGTPLLVNDEPAMGLPLTTADGLWNPSAPPSGVFVGTPPDLFDSGGSNSYNNDNFAWAILGGIESTDADNRILIGQFTTDGVFTFCFNLWVRIPDDLVCNDPNCHEILEFYSEIVPSDTLGGGFATENIFTHPTLCFNSSQSQTDCLGVPNGPAQPGTSCDDGIAETTNDVYAEDCSCIGEDCQGVLGGNALPGQPCDDGDPGTVGDVWMEGCICVGVVGIKDTDELAASVRVWPNPAVEFVWVELTPAHAGRATIELLNALGSIIQTRELGMIASVRTERLDLSSLDSGIYLVRVTVDGHTAVERITIF